MRKKENKAKKEKFRQFFPENYDIGISLNEENQLRLFSKRNDSQDESLCKYEFFNKIKVQYIFLPYSSEIQVITDEFPLTEAGCQECTQAFKHPISMELIEEIKEAKCSVTGLVIYSKLVLKLIS